MLKRIVKLDGTGRTTAVGRNGYFAPAEVEVTLYPGGSVDFVEVAVYSKRRGENPPIMVELLPDEVAALIAALQATQTDAQEGSRGYA